MRKFIICLVMFTGLLATATAQGIDPYNYEIQKEAVYANGAVACAHPLASRVGAEILKNGGNAFDAAIAVQLALAVVYPGAGNIGGGGFLVARTQQGKLIALDYRETAPAAANRNMYVDKQGIARTSLSQNGHLASGIPGTVSGLFETLPYARLTFAKLIEPAIRLAKHGYTLTATEATKLNRTQESFIKYNTSMPVFVNKEGWKEGDTLIQPELAKTLERIKIKGKKGFYKGMTARLIVEEMKRGNGIITRTDLKRYRTKYRTPITCSYKGYTVVGMPPPSSGGILLCQMLGMVEAYPLSTYGFGSVKSMHVMAEAERRAYADRAEHMGDPDFWNVPQNELLSKNYLQKRMANFDSLRASNSKQIKAGVFESTETTHISIMDKWGNMVAVTTTLNGTFGSKTVVAGAGFILNNEMDDFSIKPGVPNMYGAVGGEANAITPGKRMLSSMAPTLLLQNNEPFMVVGTPGGTTIPTSVFQTIINVVDHNMPAAAAISKPKFHHQWLPDEIQVEEGFSKAVLEQLNKMGHTVNKYGVAGYATTIGRVEVVKVANGKLEAAADVRGDDSVAGY